MRGGNMDYQKMYYIMFNAVTDAVRMIEKQNYGLAGEVLQAAQKLCEEVYIEACEDETDG